MQRYKEKSPYYKDVRITEVVFIDMNFGLFQTEWSWTARISEVSVFDYILKVNHLDVKMLKIKVKHKSD